MTVVEPSTKTTAWLLFTTPAFILLTHYVAAHLAGATAHITSSPSSAPAHPQETSEKDGPFGYSHRPAGELSPNPADPYGFTAALAQLPSAWQRYPERMAEAASRYFA